MQFEIMVILAWLTRRKLVLPPPRPFAHLGPQPRSLMDFLDLEALRRHVDVLTAEEFAPAQGDHESFHAHLRDRGYSPGWNALEDVLIHPPNALTKRFELIPRLCRRRPVGITGEVDSCETLYFPMSKEHRMFGVFEAFFFFGDPQDEHRARALVRDAVRYRPEIWRLAERAMAQPPLAGEPFSSMHLRRGDFQYRETRIGPHEILRHVEKLVPAGATLYLATEETNAEFLGPFQERFRVVRFENLAQEVIACTPPHWIGIVETLLAAAAPGRFIGTRLSTFSARISTVRGHLSNGAGRYSGIDTALYYTQPPLEHARPEELRPYGPPLRPHEDEHGETGTPWWKSIYREPLWGRAYKAVWADTDTALSRRSSDAWEENQ